MVRGKGWPSKEKRGRKRKKREKQKYVVGSLNLEMQIFKMGDEICVF
jgi:hypothetical protein